MSEQPRYTYQFTDESATVVVLNSLVRDMKHTLEWLANALLALTVYNLIRAAADAFGHHWIAFTWHFLCLLVFGFSCYDTRRRVRKYRTRT